MKICFFRFPPQAYAVDKNRKQKKVNFLKMNDKNNEHKNVGMRDYAKCCEVSRLNSANDTVTVERQATAIAMSHNTELRLTHSNICLCVDALDRRHTIFFVFVWVVEPIIYYARTKHLLHTRARDH